VTKTKLTLSVNKAVVLRAKQFSKRNNTTVSELVSTFLAPLDDDRDLAAPITSRLRGVLTRDAKREEHHDYLETEHV
jgi:hypothetical protein